MLEDRQLQFYAKCFIIGHLDADNSEKLRNRDLRHFFAPIEENVAKYQ
jgi:hypothetical protein